MQTRRGAPASLGDPYTRPAGRMASSNGNAKVVPTPRMNVRRGILFPVIKRMFPYLDLGSRESSPDATGACFIWNASLFNTPSMNDDIR